MNIEPPFCETWDDLLITSAVRLLGHCQHDESTNFSIPSIRLPQCTYRDLRSTSCIPVSEEVMIKHASQTILEF